MKDDILNNSGKTLFLKHTYLKNFRPVVKKLDELEEKLKSKQDYLQNLLATIIS